MRVAVLGHRGMLGRVVARRFREQGAEILTTEVRFDGSPRYLDEVDGADAVVNAVGRSSGDPEEMWRTNAYLPHRLAQLGVPVIHASTDAVGEKSWYAMTKEDGEDDRLIIIRAGIVGLGGGILGWLERHIGATVDGYTDWTWNGITTLEWADLAWELLADPTPRVVIPGSPPISRYALLVKAADAFRWKVHVRPALGPYPLDRTQEPTVHMAGIGFQFRRLRAWT